MTSTYVDDQQVRTPESTLRTAPSGEAPEETCAACPHDLAGHDAIALRFCRATATGSLERGCVCQSP